MCVKRDGVVLRAQGRGCFEASEAHRVVLRAQKQGCFTNRPAERLVIIIMYYRNDPNIIIK